MLNYIVVLCITLLSISCTLNGESPTTPNINADRFESIIEVSNALKPQQQTFTITDHSLVNTITGMDGTKITIQPNAFVYSDNTVITTPITFAASANFGVFSTESCFPGCIAYKCET